MKKLIGFIALLLSQTLYAQQPTCNCETIVSKLIHKVETEYPGFSDKTKDQLAYTAHVKTITDAAKNASTPACEQLLKRYTDYFKDPHMLVMANGVAIVAESQAKGEQLEIDIKNFEQQVAKTKDAFEGIWTTDGYKIGIKKINASEYVGFIIEAQSSTWKPKDIKFKLFANGDFDYGMRDKSIKKGKYISPYANILYLSEVDVALIKQLPKPALSPAQLEEKLNNTVGFYFKKLSAKTSIIKLPSFEYHNLKKIDELIESNKDLLANSENLIIDLRGNPGGTTDAYQKLLPYISGKSIRHTGAEFLATQTYIDNLEAYKKTVDKNVSTAGTDSTIKKLKANLGKFVRFGDSTGPSYTQEVSVAEKSPKNIIILANKGTGSSAEYLLFVAKQSKKVKLMGAPSYGALDYGNAFAVDFGCENYKVFMPTYRALRLPDYPIDYIGIQPDVYLDSSIKDWIQFAVEYLEKN
ncbi:MAG: hypothetical protein EOO42_03610 [Flavobacteriales bacterium]|nr:MAG: hypothetical protein EOO42_03610 [Flavobacteriales bacterium]